jgi:NADPH-dependent curcumin reductase
MAVENRVWRLRKRPVGEIADDDLTFEVEPVPEPGDGELLVKLDYLSPDPTNRVWMSDVVQYMPPVALDDPMRGAICGTVVTSKHPDFAPGDIVSGLGAWADYQVCIPGQVNAMGPIDRAALADAFGLFAVVGPTAYFGLVDHADPQPGETLVVSAAAGAVGSVVGQIGKIKGCRVVGLAGTDDKCRWIRDDLGFDVAINYRTQDVPAALRAACPDGIDIYFDNVGGPILEACLDQMNLFGRIPMCGQISTYNHIEDAAGPGNYDMILMQRLRVHGFIVLDHMDRYPEAIGALMGWMAEGRLQFRVEVHDGLEHAVTLVRKLYTGDHQGKLLVRV